MKSREERVLATYDRTAAVAYARKYWTKVCSDKHVGWEGRGADAVQKHEGKSFTRRVVGGEWKEFLQKPTGETEPADGAFDCAHFISCCIGKEPNETGGGLDVRDDWGEAYGIVSAMGLYDFLVSKNWIELVTDKADKAAAAAKLSSLAAGDLIFYLRENDTTFGHVAMYMADADKRIACHTFSRCDIDDPGGFSREQQAWDSVFGGESKYTLCKIIA